MIVLDIPHPQLIGAVNRGKQMLPHRFITQVINAPAARKHIAVAAYHGVFTAFGTGHIGVYGL